MSKKHLLVIVFCTTLFCSFAQEKNVDPPKTVAILLFDGVQIIDYTAPYEVLAFSFNVFTVAQKKDTITTWRGMKVIPDYGFENCPPADIYIIPGGNTSVASKNVGILNWVKAAANKATVVMSVCNGAIFLARSGLLDNQQATTTSNLIESLQKLAPAAHIIRDKRFIDNGKIITTAGFSSGIDGSLHIISRFYGSGSAAVVARRLEYDWNPDSKYAAGNLADCNAYMVYNKFLLDELSGISVKYSGNTKKWNSQTIIKTSIPIDSLISKISKVLVEEEKWTINNSNKLKRLDKWSFIGKDDNKWVGYLSVTKTENANEYIIGITIKKK